MKSSYVNLLLTSGIHPAFIFIYGLSAISSPGQWRAKLLVEEPFERTNAARAVCSEEMWQLIRSVFQV